LTKQLTEPEFLTTFGATMTDVTETAEPIIDIWNYVEELVEQDIVDIYVCNNNLVKKVYRNDTSSFDHVLLPTDKKNVFVTIVIDLKNQIIVGHIKLDLNEKYGLR
jgi:hypothetical protein